MALIMPTIEEWEAAVRKSYLGSVELEEYDAKATPEAVRRVAQYLRGSGYEFEGSPLIEVEWKYEVAQQIQLLFDFLAFGGSK